MRCERSETTVFFPELESQFGSTWGASDIHHERSGASIPSKACDISATRPFSPIVAIVVVSPLNRSYNRDRNYKAHDKVQWS